MTLKEIRKNCKLTQKEAAEIIGMPLRTYVSYESDEENADQIKLEGRNILFLPRFLYLL